MKYIHLSPIQKINAIKNVKVQNVQNTVLKKTPSPTDSVPTQRIYTST
jgi:hypothetical protein